MACDAVITVYNKSANDPRIVAFQQELVNRYLPEGIAFLQLDMQSVMAELEEPQWASSRQVHEGERLCSTLHGKCLDKCVYSLPYDHFIILDSDAVPLGSSFFDFMLSNRQWLIGTAHAANHLGEQDGVTPYVSPSAMSISKQVYCFLQESFAPDNAEGRWFDTGAWITIASQKQGIPNVLLYPTECLVAKWRVGMATYGYVTNYAGLLCHMWGSRAVGPQVFEHYRDYVQLCTEGVEESPPSEPSLAIQVGTHQAGADPGRKSDVRA